MNQGCRKEERLIVEFSIRGRILAGHVDSMQSRWGLRRMVFFFIFIDLGGWFTTAWASLIGVVIITGEREQLDDFLLTAAEDGDATSTKVMGGRLQATF